jgi:hypothetical protein
MSRMLKDPEMNHFLAELQHTAAGKSYRRAWHTMIQALRNMEHLKGESPILDMNRRSYAEASNAASTSLDVLSQVYNWPEPRPPPWDWRTIYQPPPFGRVESPPRKAP